MTEFHKTLNWFKWISYQFKSLHQNPIRCLHFQVQSQGFTYVRTHAPVRILNPFHTFHFYHIASHQNQPYDVSLWNCYGQTMYDIMLTKYYFHLLLSFNTRHCDLTLLGNMHTHTHIQQKVRKNNICHCL